MKLYDDVTVELANAIGDESERQKVCDELDRRFGSPAEPLRLTMTTKKHREAALAFLSLNILIRQENLSRKRLQQIKKASELDNITSAISRKGKEMKVLIAGLEKKCKQLAKYIEEMDKLIEDGNETKWPKELPKFVMNELMVPKGERILVDTQDVYGAIIGALPHLWLISLLTTLLFSSLRKLVMQMPQTMVQVIHEAHVLTMHWLQRNEQGGGHKCPNQ